MVRAERFALPSSPVRAATVRDPWCTVSAAPGIDRFGDVRALLAPDMLGPIDEMGYEKWCGYRELHTDLLLGGEGFCC